MISLLRWSCALAAARNATSSACDLLITKGPRDKPLWRKIGLFFGFGVRGTVNSIVAMVEGEVLLVAALVAAMFT